MQTETNPIIAKFLASIPSAKTLRSMDRQKRFQVRSARHAAIRSAIAEANGNPAFSVKSTLIAQGFFFGARVAEKLGFY
jgi:hypothetical protein